MSIRVLIPLRRALIRVRVAAAAAALVMVIAGCGAGAPRVPTGHNLLSILQDDALLRADPGPTLAAIHRLGVDAIRYNVRWSSFAPDPSNSSRPAFAAADPAAYPAASWMDLDRIVRDATADGVRVDLTLTGPGPVWAAGSDMPHTKNCPCGWWKPSAAQFGAFVHAVGERYSGHYRPSGSRSPLPRVSFWSIWNEPNYGVDLAPQAEPGAKIEVAPRLYRGLVDAAWTALAATGHTTRTDTILIGETAPRGNTGPNQPGNFDGTVPLRFIRALYCVNASMHPLQGTEATLRGCPATAAGSRRFPTENPALFHASGWSDHPYPLAVSPTLPTPPPYGDGFADFAALPELESTLDRVAAAYGRHPRFPIYSTEFGYMSDTEARNLGVTSSANAAAWLNESEYLSWINQRIRSYDQYLLQDPAPTQSTFDTGLITSDGRQKPDVYNAFRMPLWLPRSTGSAGSPLVVWGCVRPAPDVARQTGRPQRVAIELARTGSSRFGTVRTIRIDTARGCYFATSVVFRHSGTVRLAWSGAGPTVYSRIQPITIR